MPNAQLTCPGCGAAAAPDATRCDFCGGPLVKIACPSCFGALFDGMRFCPQCGVRADRSASDAARALRCPGCTTDMRVITVGDTELHECPDCSSSWLSTETFVAISVSREQRGAISALIGATSRNIPVQEWGSVKYRKCPACAKLMNRTNFGKRSGVIVDVCRGHGVWFECQELQRVLAFIDQGGLERTREMDREKMAAEQAALQAQLKALASDRRHAGAPLLTINQGASEHAGLLEIVASLLS